MHDQSTEKHCPWFLFTYAALYPSKVTLSLPKIEVYCQATLILPNGPNGKISWKKPSHHPYIRIPTDDFTTVNYASGGSTPSTCLPGSDII